MVQLKKQDLTWHVAGDEVVVLDLGGSVYLKLNGSARVLWECLADGATEQELSQVLVDTYDIDDELAQRDAIAFVADLRGRHLLEE